ncbi:Ucp2 [Symbiodinium sp. CCMP2456]|nr:Ucp2 [Symbiodinium sp. CCMP2456]
METQTDANSPHWVCLLIAIWQYDKTGGYSSLDHVEEEVREVHRAVIESGLCREFDVCRVTGRATFEEIKAEVKSAVQKLGRGSTWIVPSCGLKWNNCVLLECEVKAEVCRQQKNGFCLDVCFFFSSCRTWWENSPLKGTPAHADLPVWSDDNTVHTFYPCPERHPIMDYPFLGVALANFLRARPETFETLVSKLKEEIKYISLGELDPKPSDPPTRIIHLYVGGSQRSLMTDALMTGSVLGCFRNAVLLRPHLVDIISAEMSNYAATREQLKAVASLVKTGELELPDCEWWLCDIDLQLQVLASDQLLDIKNVLTEYVKRNRASGQRRVAETEVKSWGKIRKESLRRFVSGLRVRVKATRPGSDRVKLGAGVRRLLTILASSSREISPPPSARGSRNEEAMRVLGVEAQNMTHQDQINFIEAWYSVCEETGIDGIDPNYILDGSLYIFSVTGAIPDGLKQHFCQRLQERLREPHHLKDWSFAKAFARAPAFQLSADVPARLTNLVRLAEQFRGELDPAPASCFLHVLGFKQLVEMWLDQGHWEETGQSGDWRIRLIYSGMELADREWLRGASNLQIVAEPTWRFWAQHPKFEALGAEMTGLIRDLSTKVLDGRGWADDEAFMDLEGFHANWSAVGPLPQHQAPRGYIKEPVLATILLASKFALVSCATTGSLGAALANPIDLVRVRLQGEAGLLRNGVYATGLHAGHGPRHAHTLRAFVDIFQLEGLGGLWRGVSANVARASLLSSAQLTTYDQCKQVAVRAGWLDGPRLHLCSSCLSGFVAQIACMPADVVKTRVQCGAGLFQSPLQCAAYILREEGPRGFYRGFAPAAARQVPVMAVQMPIVEQIRKRLFGLGYM